MTTKIKKYWADPVWSKVIAGIILGILTAIYLAVKSLIMHIPYKTAFFQLLTFFQSTTSINNAVIVAIVAVLIYLVFKLLSVRKQIQIQELQPESATTASDNKTNAESNDNAIEEELPIISELSTAFFCARVASAFPGVRGLEWINSPSGAVKRLDILLRKPLRFKPHEIKAGTMNPNLLGYRSDPIWWFRAGLSLQIERFELLSKTKCLINHDELEINKIAVFHGDAYYRDFVYVETKPDKQIGLYERTDQDIKEASKLYGYFAEEYALYNGKPIKRTEYDDGAAVINGKVVDTFGADLRRRYLTKYNFIITAAGSPYNSHAFDRMSEKYFNGILDGTCRLEDMIEEMKSLPKNET